MNAVVLPEDVSQLVARTFQQFGLQLRRDSNLNETILVGDGQYVARSYRAAGLMAMWFIKEGIVQFYDAQGDLLRTIRVSEKTEPRRAAA